MVGVIRITGGGRSFKTCRELLQKQIRGEERPRSTARRVPPKPSRRTAYIVGYAPRVAQMYSEKLNTTFARKDDAWKNEGRA